MPRDLQTRSDDERWKAASRIAKAADEYNKAVLDAVVKHGLSVVADFVVVDRDGKELGDEGEHDVEIETIKVSVTHTTEYM